MVTRAIATSILLPALALALAPAPAGAAGAPRKDSVTARVDGYTVLICETGGARNCDNPREVVRQKKGEKTLWHLPNHCRGGCIVDECVDPGTYRYAPISPRFGDCVPTVEVTVTAERPHPCRLKMGNERPEEFNGSEPWGETPQSVCTDGGSICGRCGVGAGEQVSAREAVLAALLVVPALGVAWRRRAQPPSAP